MFRTFIRISLLMVLLSTLLTVDAQCQTKFKVLAVRGSVQISGNSVRLGQALSSGQKITVGKEAYVSLAHTNGRAVEIKKAGTYSVNELDKKASSKTKSSTSKFASYVVSELTEVKEPVSFSDDRRSKMKTTGAVERAVGDDVSLVDSVLSVVGGPGELRALAVVENSSASSGKTIIAITPRHTRLLGQSITFVWHKVPNVNSYKIVVTNRSNSVVYSNVVADTMITTSISDLKIPPASLCYWHVENASDASLRSDEFSLWDLSGEEKRSAEQVIAEIQEDVSEDDMAIRLLILGAAYEDMGLNADAHASYAKAVEIAPDIQNYKRLYADFLRRQGLNLDAYLAYR